MSEQEIIALLISFINPSFILKIILIILLLFHLIFSLILFQQTRLMTRVLEVKIAHGIIIASLVHLACSLLVLIYVVIFV